jgi:hypothetical protein
LAGWESTAVRREFAYVLRRYGQEEGQPPPAQPPGDLRAVTADFTSATVDALGRAAETTGETRTDVINKAVQIYAYITAARAEGCGLDVADEPGSAEQPTIT